MHENVPVRFGRGRLDSLATKGLAAYLIAGGGQPAQAPGKPGDSMPRSRPDGDLYDWCNRSAEPSLARVVAWPPDRM